MSKKEFNSMVDFQNILDELEKITYEHEGKRINENIRERFENLKQEAAAQAEEDLTNIFARTVMKNVETLDKVPEPLTLKESQAFDVKKEQAKALIQINKNKIKYAKELLEEKIREKKGFDLQLKNRALTKKAAKRFFKENKDYISFEDYKKAREYKRNQNKNEIKDFMKDE